jgi:hypothetical protein
MMTREEWLTTAGETLLAEFDLQSPRPWRVAPASPKGSTLGQCFASAASSDGANEIYVSLSITCPVKAVTVLLHELLHAIDDCQSGHKGRFEQLALLVGLERPLTHYNPSDALTARITELVAILPPSPLVPMAQPKKQKGRMVALTCTACGWKAHTTRPRANALPVPAICPCCQDRTLLAAADS